MPTMVAVAPASQACRDIGRDQIVGFVAVLLQARHIEGARRLPDEGELGAQVVGRRKSGFFAPYKRSICSLRNVFSDLSNTTARWVGRSCGFMSRISFHNMLQKPSTALTCSPSICG